MQYENHLEGLDKVSVSLLLTQSFYGQLLAGINRTFVHFPATGLQLRYERGDFSLQVGSEYWENSLYNQALRVGALKHELLHLIFRHHLLAAEYEDAFLFDLAADLMVNQYLTEKELTAPTSDLKHWPDPAMEFPASLADIYVALRQMQEAKNPWPWLVNKREHRQSLFAGHTHWHHPKEKALRELEELAIRRLISRAVQRLRPAALAQLPAAFGPWVWQATYEDQRSLHWRQILRLFVASSSRTQLKNTIRRPSRRYGTTPGIKIERHHRLMVALDTSGSIDNQKMALFFSEVKQLWRLGATILLVECDDAIRAVRPYQGQTPLTRQGQGGTDFNPVLQLANAHPEYDALLYFTDGQGPVPDIVCRIPILWVLTKEGVQSEKRMERQLPGRWVVLL